MVLVVGRDEDGGKYGQWWMIDVVWFSAIFDLLILRFFPHLTHSLTE